MEDKLFRGNREPTLDEILAEPIVQTLMRRDAADATTVRRLMGRIARQRNPGKATKFPTVRITLPQPPTDGPAQASAGVLAHASTQLWPRIFPSL